MFRNYCRVSTCIAILILVGASGQAYAQSKPAANPITLVHGGVDRLYEDISLMFDLAKEPKQLETLKNSLDVYFEGMDRKKPVVMQYFVRSGKFNSALHVPTVKGKDFRDNIRTLGFKNRPLAGGMYMLNGAGYKGFLKESVGNSIIAEERSDTVSIGDLTAVFKKFNPDNHDGFVSIVNSAAQTKDRADAIEEVRKQVLPGLKPLKKESPAQFELRKLTLDQQFAEIIQVYSEAASITSHLDVDPKTKELKSVSDLSALPGTDLAKGIAEMGKTPSLFAAIPLNNTDPLSSGINFKLDALRQKHMLNFVNSARPIFKEEINESTTASAKTKQYSLISTDIIFDVIAKCSEAGQFDSRTSVTLNASGKHTLVGGVKVDGTVARPGLEKLKAAAKVELDAAKVGEVSLHRITLPDEWKHFQEIFGEDMTLVMGTGPEALWFALGEGAEAKLKGTIEKESTPGADDSKIVLWTHAKVSVWYGLWDAHRTKMAKGDPEDRKEALAALKSGKDFLEFQMLKEGEKLVSTLVLKEGMLRYMGKAAAKIVRENLAN